jgi:predicted DNA-binding transcriptional regulator YafY
MGFGALARVISPPELVAQVLDDFERARAAYEGEAAAKLEG